MENMPVNKRNCRGCEFFSEEYSYSVCFRDKENPKILPNDEGYCLEIEKKHVKIEDFK